MPAHFGLGISMLMIDNLSKGSKHLVSDQTAGWSAVRECGISYPKSLAFLTTIYLVSVLRLSDLILSQKSFRFVFDLSLVGEIPCLHALRPGESHTYTCSTTKTSLNHAHFNAAYTTKIRSRKRMTQVVIRLRVISKFVIRIH